MEDKTEATGRPAEPSQTRVQVLTQDRQCCVEEELCEVLIWRLGDFS